MSQTTGMVALARMGAIRRFLRFYPRHYPPPQEVATVKPYFMFPHLDSQQQALVEKSKGDWKELTNDERVQLYRAAFSTTFAEQKYPPSWGFQVFGGVFWVLALVFPVYAFIKTFILKPAPAQLHPKYQEMLKDRLDALHANPVWGGPGVKYYEDGNLKPREGQGY